MWRLDGDQRSHFQDGSFTWLLAGVFLPQVDPSMGLLDCLHNMAAGFLPNEWSERECDEVAVLPCLALEVTLWCFHNILLVTKASPIQQRREAYKYVNGEGQESWGPILEVGYHRGTLFPPFLCNVMIYCSLVTSSPYFLMHLHVIWRLNLSVSSLPASTMLNGSLGYPRAFKTCSWRSSRNRQGWQARTSFPAQLPGFWCPNAVLREFQIWQSGTLVWHLLCD